MAAILGSVAKGIGSTLGIPEEISDAVVGAVKAANSGGSRRRAASEPSEESTPRKQQRESEPSGGGDLAPQEEAVVGEDDASMSIGQEASINTDVSDHSAISTLGIGNPTVPLPPTIRGGPMTHTRLYKRRFYMSIPYPKLSESTGTAVDAHQDWFVRDSGFYGIPWKSSAMYLNGGEMYDLISLTAGYRFKRVGFRMSNFTVHSTATQSPGSTTVNINGLTWESVVRSSENIEPFYIYNEKDYPKPLKHDNIENHLAVLDQGNVYKEYTYKVAQIPYVGDHYTSGVNKGQAVLSCENYSQSAFTAIGRPPITSMTFAPTRKQWFAGELFKPRSVQCNWSGNKTNWTQTIVADQRPGSITRGADGIQNFNSGNMTVYNMKNGVVHHEIFSKVSAPVAKYAAMTDMGNSGVDYSDWVGYTKMRANSKSVQQMATRQLNQPDLFAFRIVPNFVSNDADTGMFVNFILETEAEVEYKDVFSIASDGARRHYFGLHGGTTGTNPTYNGDWGYGAVGLVQKAVSSSWNLRTNGVSETPNEARHKHDANMAIWSGGMEYPLMDTTNQWAHASMMPDGADQYTQVNCGNYVQGNVIEYPGIPEQPFSDMSANDNKILGDF